MPLWWSIWFALLTGVTGMAKLIPPQGGSGAPWWIGVFPLTLGVLMRFLVIPRFKSRRRLFPIYVIGLAMVESCGLLGIFIAGEQRLTLVALSLIGMILYMPLFVKKLEA